MAYLGLTIRWLVGLAARLEVERLVVMVLAHARVWSHVYAPLVWPSSECYSVLIKLCLV